MIDLKALFEDESEKTNPVEKTVAMPKQKQAYVPYAEKLRDPRWQKKRLEVMERDEFMCVNCRRKDKTLNVHHWYYEKGADPWDYPVESMVCLCEDCHAQIEVLKIRLLASIGRLSLIKTGIDDSILWLTGYVKGQLVNEPWDEEEFVSHYELCGAFSAWDIRERWLDQVLHERLDQWRFSGDNQEESTGGPVLVSGLGFFNAKKFAEELQAREDEVDRLVDEYIARRQDAGHEYAGWWL